jgi:hypothetical protein
MVRIGKNKPGLIIIFIALVIILGFVAFAIFTVYLDTNKEITLYKNVPRAKTPGMVSEYENNICWISGILKADDPGELLVSPGAGKPCVYYHFFVEYAVYEIDSEGDVDKTWHTSIDEEQLAQIPFVVGNRKYRLNHNQLKVDSELENILDRKETRHGTEYRYNEDIIPDGAEIWVIGIPVKERINPTEEGLIITMNTPDKYIGNVSVVSVVLLLIVVMLIIIIGIFIWIIVRMVKN